MLRKIRIALAAIMFVAVTALFVVRTEGVYDYLSWTAMLQFLPAALALHFGVVVGIILLTLLVGRWYCSVVCPMGVLQDIISWLNGRRGRKHRNRFSYSKEKRALRYGVLLIFILALVAGLGSIVALLAPYSSYGRIASNVFSLRIISWSTFAVALATFIIIAILAWRGGRTYCNTICPVGTVLGFFSRFALLRPVIDADKCKNCSLCARQCKASCIDFRNHRVDTSRCVACMNCLGACKHGALTFSRKKASGTKPTERTETTTLQPDTARRAFLVGAATMATTSLVDAQEKKVDGGLAVIVDKERPSRATPIVPPGAWSAREFAHHCTACQLCVSACPNDVLRPSTKLSTLMQPEMSYERGYCRPECTRCSEVCPAGAIRPISVEQKSATRIGHAVWVKKNCVPLTDGVSCGNCARHCPTGAIQMIASDADNPESPKIPAINAERCIGCGACENLCPARPFSAIYVEGHSTHSEY